MKIIGQSVARGLLSIIVLAGVGASAARAADEPLHPAAINQPAAIKLQLDRRAFDTPRGIAVTYIRIRNGARTVCGFADSVLLEERAAWESCVAATIRHTVEQIDDVRLTDYYVGGNKFPARESASLREPH